MIDAFPVNQQEQIRVQLSTNLVAVLSQGLCRKRGGKGRIAAYEFMLVTPAIANLIRENKTYRIDSAIQTGAKYGMQLMDDHLWRHFMQKLIDSEELVDKARRPNDMEEKLKLYESGLTTQTAPKNKK